MHLPVFASLLYLLGAVSAVSWTASPFNPPAIPLAVRSPYLSCWLKGGNKGGGLAGNWPQFWNGTVLGWTGYVRVDGKTYTFFGDPLVPGVPAPPLANQTAFQFTSTQSIFTLDAGPVTVTANFLSPIEPNDLLRQSLPFSYFSVSVASNDGAGHAVQLYTDISAEWASGAEELVVNWTTTTGSVTTHQVSLESPEVYTEYFDHAQYGSSYYAAMSGGSYQTGEDTLVRAQFIMNGTLTNGSDTDFRPVNERWPVFAHAFDLGTVQNQTDSVVFAVGHARDPAIRYITTGGVLQDRRSYFFSNYSSVLDVISFFIGDYSNAVAAAHAFDAMVEADAGAISNNYADVVALSARQAFGATELTIGSNASDIMMFMKEISSDGNVNTVDVMFPSFPIFLYTNPLLGRYLLEPLLQYQETGQYPFQYAVHDMGMHYPVANGYNDGSAESMPVEESGNMLIMAAAYIKATNDTSLATSYYNLFSQWTSYLANNSLIPSNQLSTDDFDGTLANQTNLAIKGIIGIGAMSQIAMAAGNSSDHSSSLSIAQSFVPKFQGYAMSASGSHLVLSYGNENSWGLAYNLYADRLLSTNLFPQGIFDMETAWYRTVTKEYGIPLDSRHNLTLSDWEVFMSAAVTNNSTRDIFIDGLAGYLRSGFSSDPLSDLYDAVSGDEWPLYFKARPTVGAHFAHLALAKLGGTMPLSSTNYTPPSTMSSSSMMTSSTAASVASTTTGSSPPAQTSASGARGKERARSAIRASILFISLALAVFLLSC